MIDIFDNFIQSFLQKSFFLYSHKVAWYLYHDATDFSNQAQVYRYYLRFHKLVMSEILNTLIAIALNFFSGFWFFTEIQSDKKIYF